jgi:hypothetical protein
VFFFAFLVHVEPDNVQCATLPPPKRVHSPRGSAHWIRALHNGFPIRNRFASVALVRNYALVFHATSIKTAIADALVVSLL